MQRNVAKCNTKECMFMQIMNKCDVILIPAASWRLRDAVCQRTGRDQRANEIRVGVKSGAEGSCPVLYPVTWLTFILRWKELLIPLTGISIHTHTSFQPYLLSKLQQGDQTSMTRWVINDPNKCDECQSHEQLEIGSKGREGGAREALQYESERERNRRQQGGLKLLFLVFCNLWRPGGMKLKMPALVVSVHPSSVCFGYIYSSFLGL